MSSLRIIIADDHDLFRSGLVELLSKKKNLEVVDDARDGQDLLNKLAKKENLDIVLLDLSMPNMSGFEVLDKIFEIYPQIKVIVISMHDDGNYIAKCAKKGVYSYLLKNTDEEILYQAIENVGVGKKFFSPDIAEKMVNFLHIHESGPKNISRKETEVLKLLAKGYTTKEIAEKLYISTRTVETHRANLLKKQQVKNTAELIKKAIENKLI